MNRFQIVVFSVLHVLSVLLLPLLITLLGGCLEIEKLEVPPKAECEDVEAALNSAYSFTPQSLKPGDFVHTAETQAPMANNPQKVADIVEELIGTINQNDGTFETRTLQTVILFKDGQQKSETKEAVGYAPVPFALCPSGDSVGYYGLQVYHRKAKATDYRDTCGDFANCEFDITEVKFDQLVKLSDGRQDVRRFDFIIGNNLSYIAKNLKSCMSGTVQVDGQPVPITQCSTVQNFGHVD